MSGQAAALAVPLPITRRQLDEYVPAVPASLPEFKQYRPKAGHPDWPTLMREARATAAELLPTLERPEGFVQGMRRRLASYGTTLGNYRINRQRMKQGREDFRPLYFIWTTLRTCNFRCTYCDDHQGHKYPDLETKGALDTAGGLDMLRVMRTQTPSVYFAGGEPTVRGDLPELTRAARDMNYFPIIINTNGSMVEHNLRKPAWKTWLADTDIVIVSLDALDLKTLQDMYVFRRPQNILRNLLILRELRGPMRFKLMVNCVIQPGLIDEARAVLDFANDMGIWFCPVPMNVGPTISGDLQSDPHYREFAEEILRRKRDGALIIGSLRMNRRLLFSEKLDCRNTLKPHIDYDGQLAWPCKACVNVKPRYIPVRDFRDVDSLYDYARTQIEPTRFHGPAANQCGANCNWAQNYSTDAYFNGLRNPLSMVADIGQFLRRC